MTNTPPWDLPQTSAPTLNSLWILQTLQCNKKNKCILRTQTCMNLVRPFICRPPGMFFLKLTQMTLWPWNLGKTPMENVTNTESPNAFSESEPVQTRCVLSVADPPEMFCENDPGDISTMENGTLPMEKHGGHEIIKRILRIQTCANLMCSFNGRSSWDVL